MKLRRSWKDVAIQSWSERAYYRRLWLEAAAARPEYPASRFKGRGVVFCITKGSQFGDLWVNFCLLRRVLKCDLPIEIWHFGQGDFAAGTSTLSQDFAVEIVNGDNFASTFCPDARSQHALQALSLVHSSFAEAIFLAVDSYPVRDPAILFDQLAYRWTGAFFWPDIVRTDPCSLIWSTLDIPFVDEFEWSTGQIIVDKRRSWAALSLLSYLNRHDDFYCSRDRDGKMAVYAAWKKLDHPYSMTRQAAQCVEAPDGRRYLNQFDLRGELLFQARAGADGAPSHHSTGGNSYFIHSKISEEFLQELRGRWPDDRGKYELN